MKKSKKFFTEEKVDEIFDIMFDLAMGLGPILMILLPILCDAFLKHRRKSHEIKYNQKIRYIRIS